MGGRGMDPRPEAGGRGGHGGPTARSDGGEDLRPFRDLVERSDHMIARHSPGGRFVYVSPGARRVLGYEPADLVGVDPYALLHPDDVMPVSHAHGSLDLSDEPVRVVARMRHRDGRYVWCHSTARAARDPRTGALVEVHTSTRDASEWREARQLRRREEAARAALAEHEALLRVAKAVAREDSPEAIFQLAAREAARLLDGDAGRIARFDGGDAVVFGAWGPEAPTIGARFPLRGDRPVVRVFRTGRPARTDSYARLRERDRHSRLMVPPSYASGVAAPIRAESRLWGVIVVSRTGQATPFADQAEARLGDFAELLGLAIASAAARAELKVRAATDGLTGLANHRTLFERLEAEAERTKRHGHALSLVILDIDQFKLINDAHGHPVGDRVLVEVARRLASLARAGDTVARIGGEEFAWLLPETDGSAAGAAARRAWSAIRDAPFDDVGPVTVSVGAFSCRPAESAREVYRHADDALYRAKAEGRDRVATLDGPAEAAEARAG
ncbi:MAG: diguanylate cyclase [Actinomycetota bacterium]